jgi:hypothetical protein
MTREAGDRSDPNGVPELFFTEHLGYTDSQAIATAQEFVDYLGRWGLTITPTAYLERLEAQGLVPPHD